MLLVDDDTLLRRAIGRALERAGMRCVHASDGLEGIRLLQGQRFDVVVSDVQMPGADGIAVLRALRATDLDTPFVVMTGSPDLASAIPAVELGATLYLVKSSGAATMVEGILRAVRLGRLARAKREALALVGNPGPGDLVALEAAFERAVASLWPAFQPIVHVASRRTVAYEALLRTDEASFRGPPQFIDAAERLGRVYELGRRIRAAIADAAKDGPSDVDIFVNLHPSDLADPQLRDPDAPLSALASRVVLEVTERHSLDGVTDLPAHLAALRAMGFRIAVDDLGAGYAGLTSVIQLHPEVVKLDMSLVRGCDRDLARRQVLQSMSELSRSLGMKVVVEGVETAGEADVLSAIGCEHHQGWLYGRPGRGFATS